MSGSRQRANDWLLVRSGPSPQKLQSAYNDIPVPSLILSGAPNLRHSIQNTEQSLTECLLPK
ncbi:hypothetical protein ABIE89_009127 [Bradyrhizobium niftali]|jgi:hypothetical protein